MYWYPTTTGMKKCLGFELLYTVQTLYSILHIQVPVRNCMLCAGSLLPGAGELLYGTVLHI
jgi:hypothetical protein